MANFVIGPIAVADITLSSCIEALVRLELQIIPVAQFSHSPSLPNSPKWQYTIGVGAVILSFHSRVDATKTSCYFSDIVSSTVLPLCL